MSGAPKAALECQGPRVTSKGFVAWNCSAYSSMTQRGARAMTILGLTLWGSFNKLNRKFHDHIAAIITGVIAFLSVPALALVSYGVHVFLGAGTTGNGGSHKVAIPVAVTWAINTNRENKGD